MPASKLGAESAGGSSAAMEPAAVGVADNFVFDRYFNVFIALNHFHAGAMMVGGAVLIGLLVLGLLFPPSAAARQRTKIAADVGILRSKGVDIAEEMLVDQRR